MSWKATAWAKETRGHKGLASKLLLLVLADYHDSERGYAWPSQERLAEDCEMSIRTVKYALDWLTEVGFITVLQRGNQFQPSHYQLNMALIAPTHSLASAMRGSADIAPTPEGAIDDIVKVQSATGEGAIHVGTSLQEPSIKPSHIYTEGVEQWIEMLREIPRWLERGEPHLLSLKAWALRKGISEGALEASAIGLAKVLEPTLKKYTRLDRAFQDRINKGYDVRQAGSNGNRPGAKTAPSLDKMRKAKESREHGAVK